MNDKILKEEIQPKDLMMGSLDSLSQRGQGVAMQPDDNRIEDATGLQPYPERAEQEQSQAFSTESRVQDPERQHKKARP